jgi:hypothetical protein
MRAVSGGNYSAAPSAAGYLFQCRYALLAALEHVYHETETEIAIERFDDVSFETEGEPRQLIQTKHHLKRSGNLSDTSADLWKTLRIWSHAIAKDPSWLLRVQFFLVTTALAPKGSIASCLRPGRDRDEDQAFQRLLAIARKARSAANKPYYGAFLSLSEGARKALTHLITVVDSAADLPKTANKIEEALLGTVPRDKVQLLAQRLEGWWWGRVCNALTRPADSRIAVAEVESKIDELRESLQRAALPVDLAEYEPSQQEVAPYEQRIFVRQLRLVGIQGRRIDFAKRDFYRAFEQRSRWAREKLLFDGEILSFERRLLEEWERRFEMMRERSATEQNERRLSDEGQELFGWVEFDARFPLRTVLEAFLTIGSYHILADQLRVGWHRDYSTRLLPDAQSERAE